MPDDTIKEWTRFDEGLVSPRNRKPVDLSDRKGAGKRDKIVVVLQGPEEGHSLRVDRVGKLKVVANAPIEDFGKQLKVVVTDTSTATKLKATFSHSTMGNATSSARLSFTPVTLGDVLVKVEYEDGEVSNSPLRLKVKAPRERKEGDKLEEEKKAEKKDDSEEVESEEDGRSPKTLAKALKQEEDRVVQRRLSSQKALATKNKE